ncbi:MAG TPA: hypothetical protein DCQ92_12190 [Verrucomicrobia subdivision 3 bacterium]|nr:hypothetical protein [Limisphaerales bacterium]
MLRRKQSSETDPADWFFSAADRLRVADWAWERDGLTLTGVELLQEAVERYLKGWLIARGWSLDRTHDLRKLISVAMTIDPAFNRFKSFADELTDDFSRSITPAVTGQTSARITKLCGSRPVRSSH